MHVSRETLYAPVAGAAGGLAAALVFATAHALIIVPIWDRMMSGVAFAVFAGAGGGWAFAWTHSGPARLEARSLSAGARFGALLWLAVAPVTVADMALRAAGLEPRQELVAVAVAVVIAIAGGWLLGRRLAGTRRGAIAGAFATMLLTIAMAGPVPIGRSPRAVGIWLAVLPACVVAGMVLVIAMRALGRERAD